MMGCVICEAENLILTSLGVALWLAIRPVVERCTRKAHHTVESWDLGNCLNSSNIGLTSSSDYPACAMTK